MRIAHFIHQLQPFGSERVVETLLRYRSVQFRDQWVVARADGPMRSVYEDLGIRVFVADNDREALARLVEADVINLHLIKPEYTPACLARKLARPKVVTLHAARPFPAGMADRFIATSGWARKVQEAPERCTVIPNGVDLGRFHGRRCASPGRRVIARSARPEKSDELFWLALLPVLAEYPNVELRLAGVEGRSSRRVRVTGVLRDPVQFLSESDIFVHTPFPLSGSRDLAPMEAMAMGLPVVVTDADSCREAMLPAGAAEAVLLVPADRPDELCEAVQFLLEDPEGAARIGRRAREYAVAHFDARTRVPEYERVYAEVA